MIIEILLGSAAVYVGYRIINRFIKDANARADRDSVYEAREEYEAKQAKKRKRSTVYSSYNTETNARSRYMDDCEPATYSFSDSCSSSSSSSSDCGGGD